MRFYVFDAAGQLVMRRYASLSNDDTRMYVTTGERCATSLWFAMDQGWNMTDSGRFCIGRYMSVYMHESMLLQRVLPHILHKLANRPPEEHGTSMGLWPRLPNDGVNFLRDHGIYFFMLSPDCENDGWQLRDMMERELGYPYHRTPFEILLPRYTRWVERSVQLRAQNPAKIQALLPELLKTFWLVLKRRHMCINLRHKILQVAQELLRQALCVEMHVDPNTMTLLNFY